MAFLPESRSSLERPPPMLLVVFEPDFHSPGDGRNLRGRGLQVNPEAAFLEGACNGFSIGDDNGIPLDEVREILLQRTEVGRIEEDQHLVGEVEVLEVTVDGLYEGAGTVSQLLGVEKTGQGVRIRGIGHGNEELFLLVLGGYEGDYALGGAGPVEDFPFAIDDVLLEVHCDGLGGAEVLHGLGNLYPEFLCEGEESVYSVAGGEYDGGVVLDADSLGAEFAGGERFNMVEGTELEMDSELLPNCLVLSNYPRLILRNKYILYGHVFFIVPLPKR